MIRMNAQIGIIETEMKQTKYVIRLMVSAKGVITLPKSVTRFARRAIARRGGH